MSTEMMHPSFLLQLSHQSILRNAIESSASRIGRGGETKRRTIQGKPVRPSFQACSLSQASGSSSFQIFSCSAFSNFAPSNPYRVCRSQSMYRERLFPLIWL